ncbi:MAG TPA: chorismate synthase, partial [Oscillospiraceae bacterium]|nr:chorismate synthase [Oscillospiraceae bacterium]
MSFNYGKNISVQVFGASHADAVGAVIDGLPAGERIDLAAVLRFMGRRAPGNAEFSTARRETDEAELLSGLLGDVTTGAPVCAVIRNRDTRSGDYENLRRVPRPGHADYPAFVKFGGKNDVRGGGAFSGRMTAPLCFAGGFCAQILLRAGVEIFAHIDASEGIQAAPVDSCAPDL